MPRSAAGPPTRGRLLLPSSERRPLASPEGIRRVALVGGGGALLAGPTVLAFHSGGFFDRPRLIAALGAWAIVVVAAFSAPRPLPASTPGRVALGGLAALTAWTWLSLLWAPLAGVAVDDIQRLLLYLGYAAGAIALFAQPWVVRALEPALAGGALVVTGYGLSERLLPDLVDLDASVTAGGRLEQPLTYWNASGALAAIGLVLSLRMAGDPRRGATPRAGAGAAAVPLATGVYLSFSRGALAALAVGVVALLALAPDGRAQLRALAVTLVPGAAAAMLAGAFAAVRTMEGGLSTRRVEGLAMLLALGALAAAASLLTLRAARAGTPGGRLALPRRAAVIALVGALLVGGVLAAAAFEARPDSSSPAFGATGARLGSIESNRYSYWRVALGTFADHPAQGIGTGGFVVDWLQERDVLDPTREAHSLYLGTLAELGLVGLAALLAFLGGVAAAARRLWRSDPGLAAGPSAAFAVWAAHAGLDWDWEMPAVTLVALALAAALLAWSERAAVSPEEREGSAHASAPEPLASAQGPTPA
jgi:O-Antigen ligase